MGNRSVSIIFSSGINALTERNSSFDSGLLRIAYTGINRNGSSISKEAFEKSLPTLKYCPVVCRYDPEADEIGSHDMELVKRDGDVFLINSTHPVGFVPDEAVPFWEIVEEDDGTENEYLCTEVLLWKRQPAYTKIREDGVVKHSMELTVKDGELIDNVYVIKDFEFTALCLLGTAEPCFESSALEVFEMSEFREQYTAMMQEFKAAFNLVNPSEEVNIHPQEISEGGKQALQEKNYLLAEFGLTADQLDFDIDSMSVEELRAALTVKAEETEEPKPEEEFAENSQPGSEEDNTPEEPGTAEPAEEPAQEEHGFALAGQLREEIVNSLEKETVETPYGEMSRYWYTDHDAEVGEVYCYDVTDWKLYGFPFSLNGDNVIIDFECKKRKKFIIVDFDEGEQQMAFAQVYEKITAEFSRISNELENANAEAENLKHQVAELAEFKRSVEEAQIQEERESVFSQFGDLIGVEAFENLQENCGGLSKEELEEKCFAIRGRFKAPGNFSYTPQGKGPKLKIDKCDKQSDPYGGVVARYKTQAE